MRIVSFLVFLLVVGLGSALGQVQAVLPLLPHYVISADGVNVTGGTIVEMTREAARRAGVEVRFEIQPWARAYATASRTKDFLLLPVVRTPERENLFDWIGPVNRVEYWVYRLKNGVAPKIAGLSQLGGRSIGVLNKDVSDNYLSSQVKSEGLVRVPEYSNLVQMFLNGRFDYLSIVPTGLEAELRRQGIDKNLVEPLFNLPYTTDPYSYLVAAKGSSPVLVEALRKALLEMQKDGTWETLVQKRD